MSSSLYRRINPVIPIVAAATLAGKEGHFYKLDANNEAVIVDDAADIPHGLILSTSEDGLEISAAPLAGNHGTVLVKLAGTVDDLRKDLQLTAAGKAIEDAGTGARVLVARPLDTGVEDEMIECVLLDPRPLGAAVTLTSTNGTAAAASADIAALAAEAEKIGDDVRAMHAALVTAGYLG